MYPRARYRVPLAHGCALDLGARTLVMGILNVTPDSFADGGRHFDFDRAVAAGLRVGAHGAAIIDAAERRMVAAGADLIDLGGESARPGAKPVPEDEELRRVLPVVERLAAGTD